MQQFIRQIMNILSNWTALTSMILCAFLLTFWYGLSNSYGPPPRIYPSIRAAYKLIAFEDYKDAMFYIEGSKRLDSFAFYLHRYSDSKYASGEATYCLMSQDMRGMIPSANAPKERLLPGRYELPLERFETNIRDILYIHCATSNKAVLPFEHVMKVFPKREPARMQIQRSGSVVLQKTTPLLDTGISF